MAYTTINKSTDYFNTVIWTTDGTGNKALTTGHSTDMVWIKFRDFAYDHRIYDNVRTVTKKIIPNKNDAESTTSDVASFDTNGFTVSSNLNSSGEGGLVGWSWKANGAGVSNTDGSVTSTVSVSTTSGFSICKFDATGSTMTFGHGLGVKPAVMLIKRTDSNSNGNWIVYHKNVGATKFLTLNDNTAATTASTRFGDTEPTSSVATVGSELLSGGTYIAYCFAEKKGFSKFSSYTGNGSTDGTFVYTGFKPAFVMYKRTDSTSNWGMHDNGRDIDNPVQKGVIANASDVEDTHDFLDFFSNGFKLRSSSINRNASGGTYIYMAFAESPIVSSNGVPAVAR